MVGGPLETTLPRKNKFWEISIFCPAVVAKNYLNASPGSTSEVLSHFLLCANFWQQDPVANNDTLAKNLDAEYLILCQTALFRPLGHPDGGRDKAVSKLV
jgi:hypothetical protein